MDLIYELAGLFLTFGLAVMMLALFIVYRVYTELREQRVMFGVYRERLAAYRHAAHVAGGESA